MPPVRSGDLHSKLLVWLGWGERPPALRLPLPQSLHGSRIEDEKAGKIVRTQTELAQAEMEGFQGRSDQKS